MMSDDSKLATRKSSLLQQGKDGEPPLIPEAVLKRRHDMDEMAARRAANAILNPRGNRKIISTASKRGLVIKVRKPEKILAQAKSRRNYNIRYKRVNKKGMQARASSKPLTKVEDIVVGKNDQGHDVVEKRTVAANSVGSKMIFVVRVRGERNRPTVPRTCLEVLRKLRLNDVNEAVFIRYTDSTRKMLHLIEPYIAYGPPSKGLIRDLINRRGHGRASGDELAPDNNVRVPLSNNLVVEKALGESTGIICIDDLVHELHTVGAHFDAVATFLWPFRLTAPKSKYQKKTLHNFDSREDYGDKGAEIEKIVRQML